jgi:hypothetical protein
MDFKASSLLFHYSMMMMNKLKLFIAKLVNYNSNDHHKLKLVPSKNRCKHVVV